MIQHLTSSDYNSILLVLGSATVIIPFTGKVYDGRRKWYKRFTVKGWIVIITFILSLTCSIAKDRETQNEEDLKVGIAKIEKRKDDSISRLANENSTAKVIGTFTTSLARYGLKYDSTTNEIQKSITTNIENSKLNPVVGILTMDRDTTKSGIDLNYQLCSSQATAYNIKVGIYNVLRTKKNELIYLTGTDRKTEIDALILTNCMQLNIQTTDPESVVSHIYFYAKFDYEDEIGKKISRTELTAFDTSTNTMNYLTPKESLWIKDFYAKNVFNTKKPH